MKILRAYSWEEPHGWNGGGVVSQDEVAQTVRISHIGKIMVIYGGDDMTLEERIDEMCRQYLTTKPESNQKRRDLKRGIKKAEKMRRKEKLAKEGVIII